jgi:hypothetical protein
MSAKMPFTSKLLTASEYIGALFGSEDNVAVLARNRMTGQTVQRIAKAEIIASPNFQEWLAVQNAAGSDVFVGMNPIKDGAYSRTKDNISDIRHLYLDLDRNADRAVEMIRNSSEVPPPNFILDTSPGKHQVVWKVAQFNQTEAESLLRNLSSQFGGDPAATDSTRVLRIPGFANRKLSEEFIVQARQESEAVYTPRNFAIHDELSARTRPLGSAVRTASLSSNHKSQSERDWAYAKRALGRGDDPQVIIERIADFRAEDKADPDYYARHTVAKALAELEGARSNEPTSDREPETKVSGSPELSH